MMTRTQFARFTHLRGKELQSAWERYTRLSVHTSKLTPQRHSKLKVLNRKLMELVHKLRRKANDPAVSPEESEAFHAKANELERRHGTRC